MRLVCLLFVTSILCSGCYRMPQEDEVSLIPNTNNPSITKPSGNQLLMPPMLTN